MLIETNSTISEAKALLKCFTLKTESKKPPQKQKLYAYDVNGNIIAEMDID